MSTQAKRIVIAGAGIGGLCAAIALRNAGHTPLLFESAAELKPVGAGITIQPNAVLVLRKLGLGTRLEATGAALQAGGLMRPTGGALTHLTPEAGAELTRLLGAHSLGIHRATLHRILLEALGVNHSGGRVSRSEDSAAPGLRPIPLELGKTCIGYAQNDRTVFARFADGSEVAGDALIGADGIHSQVRQQLVGDGEPSYAGYVAWRAVTENRGLVRAGTGMEMWGRGLRFGGCCVDGDRFYWFAVANAPRGEREPDPEREKAQLIARFTGWVSPVPELLQRTPASAIIHTDIYDREPIKRWGHGLVSLLGDAAHPMTPNLGQGACQAIEDAFVLGREFGRHSDASRALRAYEAIRNGRANSVLTASRRIGAVAQWQNPLACVLRDRLFGMLPAAAIKRQLLDGWRSPYA